MIVASSSPESMRFFLVALGALFAAGSGGVLAKNERLVEHGSSTTGVITRLVWSSGGAGGEYTPEFKFDSSDGATHVVSSACGSSPCPFTVGQKVRVWYDPADPSSAEIDSFTQLWLIPGILGLAGLVMLGWGIGQYLAPYFSN